MPPIQAASRDDDSLKSNANKQNLPKHESGQVREHHRFLIQSHLEHLEFLEQQIVQFDQRIERLIEAQLPPKQPAATHPSACSGDIVCKRV